MWVRTIARDAVVGLVGATAMIVVGTGVAAAAPNGTSATESIARIQAGGNRVIINRVGDGPAANCTVASSRSIVSSPPPTGNPLTGVPNLQRVTTVHVTLKC